MTPFDQSPLSPAEIEALFIRSDPPPANTVELALVLGGTSSAGAYTAGAVDFLIEALDCWTAARDAAEGGAAPRHKVVLKVVTGTSGGGVTAAIAARALAYDYPHVVRATPHPELGAGNPLYDIWVNRLTLSGFLATSDISRGNVVSLLCAGPIDAGAAAIADFAPGPARARSWVGDPLRLILTLTNLRGMPYRTPFGAGALGQTFVDHADHIRFAVVYPPRGLADPRPDELVVGFDERRLPQAVDWMTFGLFARATAAFPLGFPPRALVRPTQDYRYRVAVLPPGGPGGPAQVIGRRPDWAALAPAGATEPPSDYHFLAVDGGATNNEPIELARTALAGVLGRNPRDPATANRAVILIDPFAGAAGLGPAAAASLARTAPALLSTFMQQTRHDSRDLLLAADPDVFSRFMITPMRDGQVGGAALASDGLGAFLGFASPAFMRHDYLLGRANCQEYLRSSLVLAEGNPVFAGMWTDAQKRSFGIRSDGVRYLPIIPLIGDAAVPEMTDPWPRHVLDPEIYRDPIERRFKAIVEAEGGGGLVSSAAIWLLAHFGERKLADLIIGAIKDALKQARLD